MLLGTLCASLLGNLLIDKGVYRAGKGKGKGVLRAGYGHPSQNKMDFQYRLILYLILKYKNIIKLTQDLLAFILEIIYPK